MALTRTPSTSDTVSLVDAFDYCGRLARSHYENFNVGGWITPKDKLPYVHAIYAWCRTVDDLGDEAGSDDADGPIASDGRVNGQIAQHRLDQLDWWESELDRTYSGQPTHPVAIAVQHTVNEFGIPKEPFLRLIHANRIERR